MLSGNLTDYINLINEKKISRFDLLDKFKHVYENISTLQHVKSSRVCSLFCMEITNSWTFVPSDEFCQCTSISSHICLEQLGPQWSIVYNDTNSSSLFVQQSEVTIYDSCKGWLI